MKKSFTLFSTIILLFIFSVLIINIFETKSLNSKNIQNQYLYIQAKNHLNFLEEYINSLKNFSSLEKIQIEDTHFNIIAKIRKKEKNYEVNLYINSNSHNISLHKKVFIK